MRNATCALLMSSILSLVLPQAGGQVCGQWESGLGPDGSGGGIAGTDGNIWSMVAWDPDGAGPQSQLAVVSGYFEIAGTAVVGDIGSGHRQGLATWDGVRWSAFPGPMPMDFPRWPLRLLGTDGTTLLGTIRRASSSIVVVFAGGSWFQVGGEFTGDNFTVSAVSVLGGELIAAGGFTRIGGEEIANVARWDGVMWRPMGAGLSGGRVLALAQHDGELVAGGTFTASGGETAAYAARWTGENWGPLGGGPPFPVRQLASADGLLYAARSTPTGSVHGFSQWNGQEWHTPGVVAGSVYVQGTLMSMVVYQGSVVAAGVFAGGGSQVPSLRVVVWDGSVWVPSASTPAAAPLATSLTLAVRDDELVAASTSVYLNLTNPAVVPVRRLSNGVWAPAGDGFDGPINHLLNLDDGGLLAVGTYSGVGGRLVRGIARWDGSAWHPMDAGMPVPNPYLTPFRGVALYQGSPVVVGNLQSIGGDTSVRSVARWNGESWGPVGAPGQFGSGAATGIGTFDGDLIVGMATGNAHRLRRFDGANWSSIPGDLATPAISKPLHFVQLGGDLVVAGDITSAGGVPMRGVARWDGQEWRSMGDGLDPQFTDIKLALHQGELYASIPHRVMRWTGSQWEDVALAGFVGQYVRRILSHDDQLWISSQMQGLARAGMSRWERAGGSYILPCPLAAASVGHDIVVGGEFMRVSDGRAVAIIGRWSPIPDEPALTALHAGVQSRTGGLARFEFQIGGTGPHSVAQIRHDGVEVPFDQSARVYTWMDQQAGRLVVGVPSLQLTDAGTWVVTVANACGEADSAPVMLEVECAADFDSSGSTDDQDVFAFLVAWFDRDPAANYDGNHLIDINDVFGWLLAWFSGC